MAAVVIAAPVAAQSPCSSSSDFLAAATTWSSPLNRRVSLHTRDVSLRDALDRLAADARVRLSYTTEALPLDARVCASFDSLALGDALGVLLRGMPVVPTVGGGEHVVLSPATSIGGAPRPAPPPRILDRVVVTGSAIEAPARRLTVAMNTVSGAQLSHYAEGNLAQALNDAVPGIWLWQTAPTSPLARYGSIRGTSSFGASYPKIYVDGIELANPLLVTQYSPETVERIEIIRGPQGAALYGTDAISGVVNIVTRHDGTNGGPVAAARSAIGAASSEFMTRSAITQDHSLTVREGTGANSASASFTSGGVGAYLPGAFVRHTSGNVGFRVVTAKLIASGTGRVFDSRSADPASPLFRDSVSTARLGLTTPQSVREYTFGGSVMLIQNEHWTHAVVAGFDGSRLHNIRDLNTPLPSASGPDLGTAGGNANLTTLKVSSVARLAQSDDVGTTITLSAENSLLDFRPDLDTTSALFASQTPIRRVTSAALAQANISLNDVGYVTAGLRLERNDALGTATVSTLPMVGVAAVRDYGPLTVKVRSAYGRGIRPATTAPRETSWYDPHHEARLTSLAPEEQSGIETGLDLFVGRSFGVQLTRFDQRASGLIQRVAYVNAGNRYESSGRGGPGPSPSPTPVSPEDRHIDYVLQNVGEITNRGWELRSDVNFASLALGATFSTVDSRVQRLARGYIGDLRVGDRTLEVPARTASLTASWLRTSWSGSVSASRSWDWINYDRIALAGAFSNSTQTDAQLVGRELRNYWLNYSGVTRLRASFARSVYRGLSLTVGGDNLLNRQNGEPDNVTVVPGRTLTFGLRANL